MGTSANLVCLAPTHTLLVTPGTLTLPTTRDTASLSRRTTPLISLPSAQAVVPATALADSARASLATLETLAAAPLARTTALDMVFARVSPASPVMLDTPTVDTIPPRTWVASATLATVDRTALSWSAHPALTRWAAQVPLEYGTTLESRPPLLPWTAPAVECATTPPVLACARRATSASAVSPRATSSE